jgi:hypothetical protein
MAIPTTSITGNILTPSGEAPRSGSITARLSAPGRAVDGAATVDVGAETSVPLGAGGSISLALVPNDNIVPSATHYLVTIILVLANGRRMRWAERWSVPYTPTAIDVGSVPRLSSSPTVYYTTEAAVAASVVADADAAQIAAELAQASAESAQAAAAVSAADAAAQVVAAAAYADQAAVAGKVYASTADGVAATAIGEYFSVPAGGDGSDFLILYKNVDDTAGNCLEVGRSPGALLLQNTGSPDYPAVLVDSQDRVVLAMQADGTVEVAALQAATINGQAQAPLPTGTYEDEVNHVISYGQSLSIGADSMSSTPLSTVQRHNSVMFNGGVRPNDSGLVPATIYASLQPLVESYYVAGGNETPVAGTCEAINDLVFAENGLAYGDHSFQILGSAAGEGSKSLAQLSKPSTYYSRVLEQVTYGKSLANAAGKTYGVRAVTWAQGESDTAADVPAATYIAALNQLVTDLNTDIKAITGQTSDVHLVTSQLASFVTYGKSAPTIALALLDAANANPLIHLAVPNFILMHNDTDQIHLQRESYKKKGAYFGKVIKRVCVDGATWSPVQPVSAKRQGSVVVLKFHVPRGPLVLDTINVRINTDYGFSLVDSGGSAITISSVQLLGDDRVKITAATAIPAGAFVRYAWVQNTDVPAWGFVAGPINGPRGNLRDSEGEVAVLDPDGLNWPLHNWAPTFSYEVA